MTLLIIQMIVEDGEVDSHIYIVQMGEAEVLKGHSSSPVTILREGDVFGEVSLSFNFCAV